MNNTYFDFDLDEIDARLKRGGMPDGPRKRAIAALRVELRALRMDVEDALRWWTQSRPCSGLLLAHEAHGGCPGYGTDRT